MTTKPYLRQEYKRGSIVFCNQKIFVDPRVLVPRKKTETTAQIATDTVEEFSRKNDGLLQVVDIGTGSGALIITVAANIQSKQVSYFATDISSDALEVAKKNAIFHNLQHRITFLQSDLLQDLPINPNIIIANLPYLPQGIQVPRDVACEPSVAVFDSGNGESLATHLLKQINASDIHPRAIILESDPTWMKKLGNIAKQLFTPAINISIHKDQDGIDRVIKIIL